MDQIAVQAREGFSVLIIEDDTSVRQLIRICLEDVGYTVKEAPNGRKGLHTFRLAPVDLVITDIFMPNLSLLHARETFTCGVGGLQSC